MKKILIIAAAALLATACSRPAADNSRKIVIWEMDDAQVAPYMDSVLDAFKKLPGNEDLVITRTHYGPEDLRSQFQAASLAGVPPDLILSPSDTAGLYAVSGFIIPLEKEFDFSLFNKASVDSVSLEGHTWGVPVTNGNHLMMFYNKKLVPSAPKNTNELMHYCATTAKKLNLKYCMAFDSGEPFWMVPWIASFGGWPIDNRTPTLNTKAVKDTVNFYHDLKYDKKFIPMECDYNCMDSLFKEEKIAFIINGDWALSSYQKHFGKNFGLTIMPQNSETGLWPAPMVSGKYFMISKGLGTEKTELLKKLINFYVSEENQIRQFKELSRLPALKKAGRSKEVLSDSAAVMSLKQIEKGKPTPMATEIRAVWDAMRNYLGEAMANRMDTDTAVRRMQEVSEKRIEEQNR